MGVGLYLPQISLRRFEIYAQRFPESTGIGQLSTEGGVQPRWRRDGKELYYLAPDGRMMSVPISLASDGQMLTSGGAIPLFDSQIAGGITPAANKHHMPSPLTVSGFSSIR